MAYPSWLPKRPPYVSLGSILLAMAFGSDDCAGPASTRERAVSASEGHQQQTPVPFRRGAQTYTTFRSHYQNAGLECDTTSAGRALLVVVVVVVVGSQERSDDDDTGKQ